MIQLYFLFQVAGQLSQHHLLINSAFIPLLKVTSLSGLDIKHTTQQHWPPNHRLGFGALHTSYWKPRGLPSKSQMLKGKERSRGTGLEPPRIGWSWLKASTQMLWPQQGMPLGLWANSSHALSSWITPSWCSPHVVAVQLSHKSAKRGEEKCIF